MKKTLFSLLLLSSLGLSLGVFAPISTAQTTASVQVLDARNAPLTTLQDGNRIQLKVTLPQPVSSSTPITFLLKDVADPVATCTIAAGQDTCQSPLFPALGWAWNATGARQTQRTLQAQAAGQRVGESAAFTIQPRPVVMVHGFNSNSEAWKKYLGPAGYLASIGLQGYAVGDGQVPGTLDTGSQTAPLARTNTIAQNAQILGQYIRNVQAATGAEQVDLVVHSMGGMISRYYLDRIMTERNVAQLIILGTPMGGSSCSVLPAALGLLLPATLEIQPNYMQGIFNPQITHRQGVPFHALAGTKLLDAVQSPCTPVPSDLVVPVASVKAISMPVQEMPLLHIDLNEDPNVFSNFVRPLLQTPPNSVWEVSDPAPVPAAPGLQFTRVYTGHLQPGAVQSVTINIDPNITVANFALYDTSHSLAIEVTGASGKVLTLDPIANGQIRVTDRSTLLYLGYGFAQPKAGQWVVALHTTTDTPTQGADYALAAQFNGGATLEATLDKQVLAVGQPLTLKATLTAPGQSVNITSAAATVRLPDGSVETYPLTVQGTTGTLTFSPAQSGLHGLELNVVALTDAGLSVDRAAFLVFETEPTTNDVTQNRLITGVLVGLFLLMLVGGGVFWWRQQKARAKK